ncbi:MAG: hypothetical protein V7K68_12230 [Nostoc sp.]|uniref:hypothetical protein n=1 Tax=Nostoc sp. TaxID=1180 RepID=UPI002FFA04C9
MPTLKKLLRSLLKVTKERGLNKMQNFMLTLNPFTQNLFSIIKIMKMLILRN